MAHSQKQAARPRHYAPAAIVLHWTIAALLVFQVSLGWRLEDLAKGAAQFEGYQLHKSVGMLILLLSLARLAIRLVVAGPASATDKPALQWLARTVHAGFYAVMILGPLSGWIMISTAKIRFQTMLFGAVPLPSLPLGAAWNPASDTVHGMLGWAVVVLLVLHVAGALRHHFAGEELVARMIPLRTHRALGIGIALALAGVVAALFAAKAMPFGASAPRPAPPVVTAQASDPSTAPS